MLVKVVDLQKPTSKLPFLFPPIQETHLIYKPTHPHPKSSHQLTLLNFPLKLFNSHSMALSYLTPVLTILFITSSIFTTRAQISTPCTASMITTFTPCLSFVTGSSASGSSPTQQCCNSVKTLTADSMDCACLIITGNVPVSIPFVNRNLAISLPRVCKSSVPIQCKASGVPLPAPGPVLFGPTLAPAAPAPHSHSHSPSPSASKAAAVDAPPPDDQSVDDEPAAPPVFSLGPTSSPGIRPVVNPNSASNTLAISFSSTVVMFFGLVAFKFFFDT